MIINSIKAKTKAALKRFFNLKIFDSKIFKINPSKYLNVGMWLYTISYGLLCCFAPSLAASSFSPAKIIDFILSVLQFAGVFVIIIGIISYAKGMLADGQAGHNCATYLIVGVVLCIMGSVLKAIGLGSDALSINDYTN